MNSSIMVWASDELYDGRILAHESVASHNLFGLLNLDNPPSEDTDLG